MRTVEDLATIVAEAIYYECFDMPDCMESTIEDVEADAIDALSTGQADYLLNYMRDIVDEMSDPSKPDEFRMTISAIEELEAFMN